MAVDPAFIGTQLPATTLTVDAGRLRFFAKAIGETNPLYTDVDAAKAARLPSSRGAMNARWRAPVSAS